MHYNRYIMKLCGLEAIMIVLVLFVSVALCKVVKNHRTKRGREKRKESMYLLSNALVGTKGSVESYL